MHSALQPTHSLVHAAPLHPALATACIDGIWAAGGGCGVEDMAGSRGCCPIEMCARVIMGEVVVEVSDDVVKCMQQNYGQQQQQQQPYSSASAWKLALPALNTLMRAAADPSSCLNDVWLLQRQVRELMAASAHHRHTFVFACRSLSKPARTGACGRLLASSPALVPPLPSSRWSHHSSMLQPLFACTGTTLTVRNNIR
jgi:hypothetical protein